MIDDVEIISTKVPANPIPERKYEQFKSKLVECSGKYAERNLMLFQLGVGTGYRTQDIVDLTIKQIKQALEDGEFIIQEKKQYRCWKKCVESNPKSKREKPKPRKAPVKKNLSKLLREFVKNKKNSEYAFSSQKGNGNGHITEKSFSDILKKIGNELGLKHISGHSMRKTYANRLWEEYKPDIEKVRLALGHKSIEVTKVYLGIASTVINDAAEIIDDLL